MPIKVVGDICLDLIHECTCDRVSPEGPFPILLEMKEPDCKLGMAGYVVALIHALNNAVDVVFYSSWDDYNCGQSVDILLQKYERLKTVRLPGKKTIRKNRYYVGPHMVSRIDQDCYEVVEVMAGKMELGFDDVLVCSDYQKGVKFRWGKVDPHSVKYSIYDPHEKTCLRDLHGFTVITPNDKEYKLLTKQANSLGYEGLLAYLAVEDELEKDRYLVHTVGERGVILEKYDSHTGETVFKRLSPLGVCKDRVVDIVGAGDCVVAGLAVGLYKGLPFEKALIYGMIVAEVAIMHKGTYIVDAQTLRRYLQSS